MLFRSNYQNEMMENPLSPPRTEPVQPMPDDPLELGKKARFFRV